jgi:hypothetical protein
MELLRIGGLEGQSEAGVCGYPEPAERMSRDFALLPRSSGSVRIVQPSGMIGYPPLACLGLEACIETCLSLQASLILSDHLTTAIGIR